jgi:hypothetical protein
VLTENRTIGWDPEWAQFLTDSPCKCGNDLGLPGGVLPHYAEGSGGLAEPRNDLTLLAVEVPDRDGIIVVSGNKTGRAKARFTLPRLGYHVMVSPAGQQYACKGWLVAKSQTEATDATVYVRSDEPLDEFGPEGNFDLRVAMMRHYWLHQGYPNVQVWGLRRIKPATVEGQFALVRFGTRWHTDEGVFRDLGATYALVEPDGFRRFLTREQMAVEFTSLLAPDGSVLREADAF